MTCSTERYRGALAPLIWALSLYNWHYVDRSKRADLALGEEHSV